MSRSASGAAPALQQRVFETIQERRGAGTDDVRGGADGVPGARAVGRLNPDSHASSGTALIVDNPDLVVYEPYGLDLGVELKQRFAESAVKGMDRPRSLGRRHDTAATDPDFHRCLRAVAPAFVTGRDEIGLQMEVRHVLAGRAQGQELERGVGILVDSALIFAALDLA